MSSQTAATVTTASKTAFSSTTDQMFVYAPFLNLFGIFLTIVLCLMFLVSSGITLKRMKMFAFKIRIILNKNNSSPKKCEDDTGKLMSFETRLSEEVQQFDTKPTYLSLFKAVTWKYSYATLYYPFLRPKDLSNYDLLRPSVSYFLLQLLSSCSVSWILAVFFTALLQSAYEPEAPAQTTSISQQKEDSFAMHLVKTYKPGNQSQAMSGLTFCAVLFSFTLNMFMMNSVFMKTYMLNLKQAFTGLEQKKKNYQKLGSVLEAYSEEYQEFVLEQERVRSERGQQEVIIAHLFGGRNEMMEKVHPDRSITAIEQPTQIIDSTRQMIQEDNERMPNNQEQQKQINNRKFDEKDIILYLEDSGNIGEIEMFEGETENSVNTIIVKRFSLLFLVITLSSAISCYLNYQFDKDLAINAFIMFSCAFLGDHFFMRPIFLGLLSSYRYLTYPKQMKETPSKIQNRTSELQTTSNVLMVTATALDATQNTLPDFSNIASSKQKATKIDYEIIQRFNLSLVKLTCEGYGGPRAFKILTEFRNPDKNSVIRKRFLEAIFNPLHEYANGEIKLVSRLRAGASVTSEHKTNPKDIDVPVSPAKVNTDSAVYSLIQKRTTKGLAKLDEYKPILKYNTITRGKKPFFEAVKYNQSQDLSQGTQQEDSIVKGRKRHGSGATNSYQTFQRPRADSSLIVENQQDQSNELNSDEFRVIQDLEVKIFEIGNQDNINAEQKVNLTQLRLRKAQIQKLAAQRRAQRKQLDLEAQNRLEEMNEELEQLELENLLMNSDQLTPEQQKRLEEMRMKQLQKLRAMLGQKNPVNLTQDETLRLKELVEHFKVHLSPLEQHRLNEQLKRNKMFTKKDEDLKKINELRQKLKATGPSSHFETKEAAKLQALLQKHQIDLPEDEWLVFRDIQRQLGLLSKDELQLDMIAQLRGQLLDPQYKTTFQKVHLKRLMHLLDKHPIYLSDQELERLYELKSKFGGLTQKDRDLLDFTRLKAQLLQGQIPLSPQELAKLQSLKQTYTKSLKLSDQDESRLTDALSKFTQGDSLQHQNTDANLRASEQSASVNGDQVIFRTLDSLMQSKKMKQSQSLLKMGSITSDTPYAKDDMTNYSRAFGVNKRKKKKKVHKRANATTSVMYDVDRLQEEVSEKLSSSENEEQEEMGDRRSIQQPLVTLSSGGKKSTSPPRYLNKERLETLQEIYTQDLREQFSPTLQRQLSSQRSINFPSSSRGFVEPTLNAPDNNNDIRDVDDHQSEAVAAAQRSTHEAPHVQYESDDNEQQPSSPAQLQQQRMIVNRFMEDDNDDGKLFKAVQIVEETGETLQERNTKRKIQKRGQRKPSQQQDTNFNPPLLSSGRLTANSDTVPQAGHFLRVLRPSYRELSLKQITEALGSGASSRSSMGGNPLLGHQLSAGDKDALASLMSSRGRVKSQEGGSSGDLRRKRMQTFGVDLIQQDQQQQRPGREERRKIQSSGCENRPFILQQDEAEGQDEDVEDMSDGENSMLPKSKIIRKRGGAKKRGTYDFESPYAEYLLSAIKDSGSKAMVKVPPQSDPQAKLTNEVRLQKIKSIYNDTNVKSRAGRAQSPITGAMLMIHQQSNSIAKTSQEGGRFYMPQEPSFGDSSTIPRDIDGGSLDHQASVIRGKKLQNDFQLSNNMMMVNPFFIGTSTTQGSPDKQ